MEGVLPAAPAREADAATLLSIEGLTKVYSGGQRALEDVSFTIGRPEVIAVIGSSGAGKSTLIRCINRLVEPTSGRIRLGASDIVGVSRSELRRLRRRIAMIFQEFNLVERLTVMENVLSGRLGYVSPFKAWLRKYPQADINTAWELLDTVGLTPFANQRADALSGGQRQRVGIARAIMQGPELLLADEPTSSLDPKTSVEIMELMVKLADSRRIPVILNIHNVPLAKRFATHVVGMSEGRVVYDGPPDGLTDEHLKQIYGGEDWLE
jgi:phosphonate transport system ATP-binding protein